MKQKSEDKNQKFNFGTSIMGYDWLLNEPDHQNVTHLMQNLELSEILARVIINRGITTTDEAKNYLSPKLKNELPHPFAMIDMDKAVARTIQAITEKKKITIFADYDVDGATSASLLKRVFKMLNVDADIYIPSRSSEGYGITVHAIKEIHKTDTNLLISVDCGSTAVKALSYAKSVGIDAIVLDHHIIEEDMPDICALVNPRRKDDTSKFKSMAAVGVTFMFAVALRSSLRDQNWFNDNHIPEPDLMPLLDLVALGTVCDVMPLTGINRVFVKCGLHFIASKTNEGISAILNEVKRNNNINASHLGYIIGPRINAGGRINRCDIGAKILCTENKDEAKAISEEMENLNNERRSLEVGIMEDVINKIESEKLTKKNAIVIAGNNWHIGVIGIIASRIKDRYHKPSIIMSISDDGTIKGSGRSIAGIDLGSILCDSRNAGYLTEGGGHAMAGGFTLKAEKLNEWLTYVHHKIDEHILSKPSLLNNAKKLHADAILKASAANASLLKSLDMAAPFGHKNEAPKFILLDVKVVRASINKSGSVSAFILDSTKHDKTPYAALRCIAFRGRSSEIGEFLLQSIGKVINIVGSLQASSKIPNKVDFIIDDVGVKE